MTLHHDMTDTSQIPQGMLSSPHIAMYVSTGWLIENYDKSCLSSCSYHMRISGSVLVSRGGVTEEFTLCDFDDENRKMKRKLVLEPNSLTFVTTIEKFKLPRDVIARFNLKSKWVHKGLLLGTGPIVDPELKSNLLIPLHNFSSNRIEISNNEKLISVEFTKTLNPDDVFVAADGTRFGYVPNGSAGYDFRKYISRIDRVPEGSVSYTLALEKNEREDFKKKFQLAKNLSIATGLALVVALAALFYQVLSLVSDVNQYAISANTLVIENKKDTAALEKFSVKEKELNSEIRNLRHQINKDRMLHQEAIERLTSSLAALDADMRSKASQVTSDKVGE